MGCLVHASHDWQLDLPGTVPSSPRDGFPLLSRFFGQAMLCGVMWGLNRWERPAWTTGCLIPLSFGCGIGAAVIVWQAGERTKVRPLTSSKAPAPILRQVPLFGNRERPRSPHRFGGFSSRTRKHSKPVARRCTRRGRRKRRWRKRRRRRREASCHSTGTRTRRRALRCTLLRLARARTGSSGTTHDRCVPVCYIIIGCTVILASHHAHCETPPQLRLRDSR